ncbi:Glucose-repressible alcohol dehydrogenase transcriptional effector [Venturia inaequalis]|nr:Glucose-repressible alcohol dehydrogenase transcriptional effector [Venturia inaequalis]
MLALFTSAPLPLAPKLPCLRGVVADCIFTVTSSICEIPKAENELTHAFDHDIS